MRTMTLIHLREHLESNFHAPTATGLDAVIRLVIGDDFMEFRVHDGRLDFDHAHATPDATFRFADIDTAWALLSGRADAFEAFMEGRFRADGYLMWAFRLMAMFQSTSLPANPVE
jgi:putative sterol carrier protein